MPLKFLNDSKKLKATASVACILAAALSIWLSLSGAGASGGTQNLYDLGRAEAQNLENAIDYGIVALQETARSREVSQTLLENTISSDRSDTIHQELRNGLASAGTKALSMELINSTGTVLACYPEGKDCAGLDMKLVPEVTEALRTRAETVGGFAQSPDGQLRLSVVTPIFIGGNFTGLARMTLKSPGGKYRSDSMFSFVTDAGGTFLYHPSAGIQGKRAADALGPSYKDKAAALERAIAQAAKGEPSTFALAVPSQDGASMQSALCSLHPVDTPSGRWVFALTERRPLAGGIPSAILISIFSVLLAGLALWLLYRHSEAVAVPTSGAPLPATESELKKELVLARAAAEKAVSEFERLRKKTADTEERLAAEILARKKTEEDMKSSSARIAVPGQEKLAAEQNKLRQQLKDKENRVAELEKAVAEAVAAKTALDKTISSSSADKTELSKKLVELQAQCSKLEQQFKQKETRIAELEKEKSALDSSLKSKGSEQEKLLTQLETAKKQALAGDAASAELKKTIAALEKQSSEVKAVLDKASAARDAAQKETASLLKEKETSQQRLTAFEAEIK
ncbi:MAG TPA: hypothetical protein PLL10_01455, partial [Elusimicrobiales bacterium]|nr:hypothetical protein [Elusimicrobiales bacterium]